MNMEENEDIKTRYCNKCLHFDADTKSCSAFPNGIPAALLAGKIKHLSKFPEQIGADVFVNARAFWEKEGLEMHPMEGIDDFIVGD